MQQPSQLYLLHNPQNYPNAHSPHKPQRSPRHLPESRQHFDKNPLTSTSNTYKKYLFDMEDTRSPLQSKRKRQEFDGNSFQSLIQNNRKLSDEIKELYQLLQERGRIITVLEKKLERETARKGIEQSNYRNRQNSRNQLKFAEYQEIIQLLKTEIIELKTKQIGETGSILNGIQSLTDRERLICPTRPQNDSIELLKQLEELTHLRSLLKMKTLELDQLNLAHLAQVELLRSQIAGLQATMSELRRRNESQIVELKMSYEHKIESCARQRIHEMEVVALQHSLQIKQLQNLLLGRKQELERVKQLKQTDKAEVDRKYEELVENNDKLQARIEQVEEYYKQHVQDEVQKIQELHSTELAGLKANHQAAIDNLRAQIRSQEQLNANQATQIKTLNKQVEKLSNYTALQSKNNREVLEGHRAQIQRLKLAHIQELGREKIKHEELKATDISALKDFYEHQIKMLNGYLHQQMEIADRQKAALYQAIDEHAQMRRTFDLDVQALSLRIRELEATIKELTLHKMEQVDQINEKLQMATESFHRQSEGKDKQMRGNQEQIKHLQDLIRAKDKQIEGLNIKIAMMKENHLSEIRQRLEEMDAVRKQKEELQTRHKKQKYFLGNQISKKEATIKNNKDIHDAEVKRIKTNHHQQYQSLAQEMSLLQKKTDSEIQELKSHSKQLKRELEALIKSKQTEKQCISNELVGQRQKLVDQKQTYILSVRNEGELERKRLVDQIEQLKKKLSCKQDETRNMNDKYYRLQQKLSMVLEGQEKLKSMENKMNMLGEENKYVQKIAEIIKQKQKP